MRPCPFIYVGLAIIGAERDTVCAKAGEASMVVKASVTPIIALVDMVATPFQFQRTRTNRCPMLGRWDVTLCLATGLLLEPVLFRKIAQSVAFPYNGRAARGCVAYLRRASRFMTRGSFARTVSTRRAVATALLRSES
jgi:hypothetical protein